MRLFAAAVIANLVSANSVPIFGTYPGWRQGGNARNIEVEIFFDYLCADTKASYPYTVEAFNSEAEAGLTWLDAVDLRLSAYPLDYHLHSWQVAQVLPYFLDLCAEGTACNMNEYLAFGLDQ